MRCGSGLRRRITVRPSSADPRGPARHLALTGQEDLLVADVAMPPIARRRARPRAAASPPVAAPRRGSSVVASEPVPTRHRDAADLDPLALIRSAAATISPGRRRKRNPFCPKRTLRNVTSWPSRANRQTVPNGNSAPCRHRAGPGHAPWRRTLSSAEPSSRRPRIGGEATPASIRHRATPACRSLVQVLN